MTNVAMIFPGQGSQSLGMLREVKQEAVVLHTLKEASEALNFDIDALITEGPLDTLNLTQHTQPALLTVSIAYFRLWQERGGLLPKMMAGHSLGEYSALVASGALEFFEACKITALRGQFMQKAVPPNVGTMAAIIGLSNEEVDAITEKASSAGVVSAANYNSIGQVVISGETEAVRLAMSLAMENGARLCTELSVSVPAHSPLLKEAAIEFGEVLKQTQFRSPEIPVIHNVDASVASTPDSIREKLISQLYSPVRWVDIILYMKEQGIETYFECGPGRVLVGLNKRIDKNFVSLAFENPENFTEALALSRGEK